MKKRLLSILLTVIMSVSLLPIAAVQIDADYETGVDQGGGTGNAGAVEPAAMYTVSLFASPADMGTLSGAGTYPSGTLVTVAAEPFAGYDFSGWYDESGKPVNASPSFAFTIDRNYNLIAVFAPLSSTGENGGGSGTGTSPVDPGVDPGISSGTDAYCTVSATVSPSGAGSVTGTGTYAGIKSVILTASPCLGYTFSCWMEDGAIVCSNYEYHFGSDRDRDLVAVFVPNGETIVVNGYTTHSVTASFDPDGIGTIEGIGRYAPGTVVTLTAAADYAYTNAGYNFHAWYENGAYVSDENPYTFTVEGNRDLVAQFIPDNSQGVGDKPDIITGGDEGGSGGTTTVDPGNGGGVSTEQFTISAEISPAGAGTVTGTGTYNRGKQIELIASANTGYRFVTWTENGKNVCSTTEYAFQATGSRHLTAEFTYVGGSTSGGNESYTISASADPSTCGTVTGAGSYVSGQTVTLTAVPSSGYEFKYWKEDGVILETTANPYTFTADKNRDLVAYFGIPASNPTYTITANVSPVGAGSVFGTGEFYYGEPVCISVVPNEGYVFTCWMEGETVISSDIDLSFAVSGNLTLTAVFDVDGGSSTAPVDPGGGGTVSPVDPGGSDTPIGALDYPVTTRVVNGQGTVSGAGSYQQGTSAEIYAEPADGYRLDSIWVSFDGGDTFTDSPLNPADVPVNGPVTVCVVFVPLCTLIIKPGSILGTPVVDQDIVITNVDDGASSGSIPARGKFYFDEQSGYTMLCIPDCPFDAPQGFHFYYWALNGNEDYLQPGDVIVADDDITLTAMYVQTLYGDANGDGVVDLRDATRIAQYANDDSIEIAPGADANGDGVVDLRDATRIAQYANDDSVHLGPQPSVGTLPD